MMIRARSRIVLIMRGGFRAAPADAILPKRPPLCPSEPTVSHGDWLGNDFAALPAQVWRRIAAHRLKYICGEYVTDHPFGNFRAAVKHAAKGDWARERAFFDRLESLCLGLIARAIQGPTPTEALIDACRFYAQAFMG